MVSHHQNYSRIYLMTYGPDHVISIGRQMTNLVSNFEYLLLLCWLSLGLQGTFKVL